jgi:hypothetical protein
MTDINPFAVFIAAYGILVVGTMIWMLVYEWHETIRQSDWVALIRSPWSAGSRPARDRAPAVLVVRSPRRLLTGHPHRMRAARRASAERLRTWTGRHPYAGALAGSHFGDEQRVASEPGSPPM